MSEPEQIGDILKDKETGLVENKPNEESQSYKGQLGGPRPNSGRPKGKLNRATLDAIKVNKEFNQRIMKHADDLFNAQFDLAVGEKVLMVKVKERDSKGKVIRVYHEIVTDKETIKQYLDNEEGLGDYEDINDDEHYYYITTKPANNQALDSLVNRALGKVADKLEVDGTGLFDNPQLTIKVVGSKHEDDYIIGDDGQLHPAGESGDTTERTDS